MVCSSWKHQILKILKGITGYCIELIVTKKVASQEKYFFKSDCGPLANPPG